MLNLSEIATEAARLRKHSEFVASENDGEISNELADALTMSELALEDKVASCVFVMRELDAEAKQNADLAAHYSSKAKSLTAQRDRLHEWIAHSLSSANIDKVATASGKVWFQVNGTAPLLLDDAYKADPSLLPPAYQKVTIAPNNAAIKADIEAGVQLPFATIGERGKSLRIGK